MYQKAYGIIETLAPLHVGATAGEETGNLNLIFRDSFTRTGIIPGSSIRGRLRSEIYLSGEAGQKLAEDWYGRPAQREEEGQDEVQDEAQDEVQKNVFDFESRIKIEHASLLWLPVFCSGQPIVWVTCPRLLARYKRIAGDLTVEVQEKDGTVEKLLKKVPLPQPYTGSQHLRGKTTADGGNRVLFFNLGFITTEYIKDLSPWFPPLDEMFGYPNVKQLPALVVEDKDMGMIHDMALYRQSRVRLKADQKVVDSGAFFNVEALPESTIMLFPIGLKKDSQGNPLDWKPLSGDDGMEGDIFLGGLESVGFGHSYMTIKGIEKNSDNNQNKEV